jgi:hypothetical protein
MGYVEFGRRVQLLATSVISKVVITSEEKLVITSEETQRCPATAM